jgi:cobalt-zinc-cadmium efflux system membrane fusion protein
MNRTVTCLLTLTVVTAFACKDDAEHGEHEEAHHEHGEHEGEAEGHGGDSNVLTIDPEMIRDLRITTTAVEERPGGEGLTALGELRVNEDAYAEVGSPIPARVLRLLAAPGDVVRAGQGLVELQSVEFGRARADYLRATARATAARSALSRARGLSADKIVSERSLEAAKADAAAAEADLAAARAGLGAFGVSAEDIDGAPEGDSSRFQLRTPVAGTVIERNAVRGQVTDPAKALFRVAELSKLWLVVHAFERDAIRVQAGASARATFPALPGQTLSGVVGFVGKQVDVSSRTVQIRIEVSNSDGVLKPGMSASAWLPLGGDGATVIAVPTSSLQRLEKGWCVFAPVAPGAFAVRPVGRGRDLGGEVEIISGLKPGETVVVDGAFLLKAEAEKARGGGEHHDH